MDKPRIIYAANRPIGMRCLYALLEADVTPVGLLFPSGRNAECVDEMKRAAPGVDVIEGSFSHHPEVVTAVRTLHPDYIMSVHFPYLIPPEVLSIPAIGTLNLHPAFLPFNRGWHTPSWAILDGTEYGATLHWVDEGIDSGDIAVSEPLPIQPSDTAHTLYQRVLKLEEEVFREAIPLLLKNRLPRTRQAESGTVHRKAHLDDMQEIDLHEKIEVRALLKRLRALTTNDWSEAAFFEEDGRRYRVHIEIREDTADFGRRSEGARS